LRPDGFAAPLPAANNAALSINLRREIIFVILEQFAWCVLR